VNLGDSIPVQKSSVPLSRTVALVFVAIVLAGFAVAAGRGSFVAAQQRNWPTVAASISSVETRKGCDRGVGYNVRISYAYRSPEGVAGAGTTERPIDGCVDEGTALSVVKNYAVGTTLKVNVNPADPQASVDALELANDASMLVAVLSSAGSLGLIGIAIASRRNARRCPNQADE
jgi:hypothetical protein